MHDPDFNNDVEAFTQRVQLRIVELTARREANKAQVLGARERLVQLQKEMQELHYRLIELGSERVDLAREVEKTAEFSNTCTSFVQKRRLSDLQEASCKRRQPKLGAQLEEHALAVRTTSGSTAATSEFCKKVAGFLAANSFPMSVLQGANALLFDFLHPRDDGTPCTFTFKPCGTEGCPCSSSAECLDFPAHLPLTFIWE